MASEDPIVLELAPLPREQIGPFLLLGLDKEATPEQIEAHWAQRIIWARKNQVEITLQDINWAREYLTDPAKRVRADISSLNPDTMDRIVHNLARSHELRDQVGPPWSPLDVEKTFAPEIHIITLPKTQDLSFSVVLPDLPREFPWVEKVLLQFTTLPVDPWDFFLSSESSED